MVNNSVLSFERGKVVLDPNDKNLIEQLYAYRVERISTKGSPVYSSENEHSLDCLNLCLLTFERKYGSLFKNVLRSKVLTFKQITSNDEVADRDIVDNKSVLNQTHTVIVGRSNRVIKKKRFIGRTMF